MLVLGYPNFGVRAFKTPSKTQTWQSLAYTPHSSFCGVNFRDVCIFNIFECCSISIFNYKVDVIYWISSILYNWRYLEFHFYVFFILFEVAPAPSFSPCTNLKISFLVLFLSYSSNLKFCMVTVCRELQFRLPAFFWNPPIFHTL